MEFYPARHEESGLSAACLEDGSIAIRRGAEALSAGLPPDAVVADVEEALSALGGLTGRAVSEDVTARIFARFCVGK